MLNIGTQELIFILVLALLVLGPKRLPELARGIGKFVREFRRQTDDVRAVVEREFYRMDQEVSLPEPEISLPTEIVPIGGATSKDGATEQPSTEAPMSATAPERAPEAAAEPSSAERGGDSAPGENPGSDTSSLPRVKEESL